MFHYFLSGDIKQDSVTTTAHINCLIELIKNKKVWTSPLITKWGNTDGCGEQYRCDYALYLMSVMPQCYSLIIYWGISAPGHDKQLVYGISSIDKHYIYINVKCSTNLFKKIWFLYADTQ